MDISSKSKTRENERATIKKIQEENYDIQGKLLHSEIDISNNLLRLSIHDFAKGLYLVEVLDINKNRSYKKLLVN